MVKVAIIGAGGIARKHAECLKQWDDIKITGVYDVVQRNAELLANECGTAAYYGSDLLKSIEAADAVYILTPPSVHKDTAVLCMKSGKAVFLEKPIAVAISDAEEIVETSHKYDASVMLGFNMRFRPGFRKLKEVLQSPVIGKPLLYWSQRFSFVGDGNWRTNQQTLSGFTIESLSHDIDLFQWLSGNQVVSVCGNVMNSRAELSGYDDNANVILQLKDGSSASIQASWSSPLEFNNRGIVGVEGTAMVSGRGTWDIDKFICRNKNWPAERNVALDDPLDARSYAEINRRFIDCMKEGRKPEITAEDGLSILRISHAILESSRTGKPISL